MKIMSYKGFKAQIMRAQRLIGKHSHDLPSGTPIEIYPVDEFKEPLSNWMQGPGNYVVPVSSDWGLWFNWCSNDDLNTAVLLSVKGMNPITGQRTNGFNLERYEEKCPIHGTSFKEGLFCEQCNYKWPDQNYIAYPNKLWWDGFRSTDGKVRQFFFTEDLAKSIPELVIGRDDTIPAFGFAFFRPKVRRESVAIPCGASESVMGGYNIQYVYFSNSITKKFSSDILYPKTFNVEDSSSGLSTLSRSANYSSSFLPESKDRSICFDDIKSCNAPHTKHLEVFDESSERRKTAEVGVGAGAIINQSLTVDTLKVTDWESKPSSIMRLFFIFIEQFEEIKAKGMKDLIGVSEGYLSDLPIG
ncbi:MAG: hypothetical protein PHF86_04425 [Candidatus Nanoarchaeia archaeon]|nr:hypothetical protein [Candidatus Nanoarchaeia archaeon]